MAGRVPLENASERKTKKVPSFGAFFYWLKLTHVLQKHPVYDMNKMCLGIEMLPTQKKL
jgi:hypothetical protein